MSSINSSSQSSAQSEALTFVAGGQLFAIPLQSVQEVRMYERPLSLPMGASACQGVLNLRGEFVPVLDLSMMLGLGPFVRAAESVTIVVNGPRQQTGLAVAAVHGVVPYDPQDLKTVAHLDVMHGDEGSCVPSILSVEGSPAQLLNLDTVLGLRSATPPA